MRAIYTLGYSGWTVDNFMLRIDLLSGHVLDARTKPWSHSEAFRRSSLRNRCQRYTWLGHVFGNVNYRTPGSPIVLADPEAGIQMMRTLVNYDDGPFVVMCGCPNPAKCHRSIVASLIASAFTCEQIVHLFPHGENQTVRLLA